MIGIEWYTHNTMWLRGIGLLRGKSTFTTEAEVIDRLLSVQSGGYRNPGSTAEAR